MTDMLEMIEDLKTLEILPEGASRDIQIEHLITKYQDRFQTAENEMEEVAFYGS